MTKRDEAVFDKAFAKMEAKGYFSKPHVKAKPQAKSKTAVSKTAKKPHRKVVVDSVPAERSVPKVPIAAQKR